MRFKCKAETIQRQYFAMWGSGFYDFRLLLGCVVVTIEGCEPMAMTPEDFVMYLDDLADGDGEEDES